MIFKLWFMAIMIYVVSTTVRIIWKSILEDKELGTKKTRLFVGVFALIMTSLTHLPLLYWSYMWIWGMGK